MRLPHLVQAAVATVSSLPIALYRVKPACRGVGLRRSAQLIEGQRFGVQIQPWDQPMLKGDPQMHQTKKGTSATSA